MWHWHCGPDWLDANFYQAKIMASQYIGLPKLDHAKMLAKNLGAHLVWCQPIISSFARFQKFLVTYQNFGYSDHFLGMNQMIAKIFWHALILTWQKLVANQVGPVAFLFGSGNSSELFFFRVRFWVSEVWMSLLASRLW